MDRGRLDELAELFDPDAEFIAYTGKTFSGRSALQQLWARRPPAPGRHCAVNSVAIVTGEVATCVSDIVFLPRSGESPVVVEYNDELARHDDAWRIVRRAVNLADHAVGALEGRAHG